MHNELNKLNSIMSFSYVLMYGADIGFYTNKEIPALMWILMAFLGSILSTSKYRLLKEDGKSIKQLLLIDIICAFAIILFPSVIIYFNFDVKIYNFIVYFVTVCILCFVLKYNRKIIND